MLDVIQPSGKMIDASNYDGLLKLARRFEMPGVSKFDAIRERCLCLEIN